MDRKLFDFAGLRPTGIADPEGDTAFDEQDYGEPRFADIAVV
jgi:tRNA 2-thiocytidine biosynthesis protein TtcA